MLATTTTTTPSKTAAHKEPSRSKCVLDDSSTRKSSLVQGELADLEAIRSGGKEGAFHHRANLCCDDLRYTFKILRQNPLVLILSFLVFATLCGCGLGLVFYLAQDQNEEDKNLALDLATEKGRWFGKCNWYRSVSQSDDYAMSSQSHSHGYDKHDCDVSWFLAADQLDRAILPLFSLAQFVGEINAFNALAHLVAARPLRPPMTPGGIQTHRDIDGICNNSDVVDRFNGIAASIKKASEMEGALITLQLVPDQVVCMVYPLINTEDFEDGIKMDSRPAIGLDLIATPSRTAFSESVLSSNGVYMAGPLTLQQCSNGRECNVSVKKAFIGALPINSGNRNHTILVNDKSFNLWGSVEAIINWEALIDRSDIFERFATDGKGFRLTRTDVIDEDTSEVVVLAETENFDDPHFVRVSITLDTVDDLWQMTIAYEQTSEDWLPYAIASTVVLAFFFASLVFLIMMQKQKFLMMQKRYMEDLAQPQKLRLRMFLDVQESAEPTAEMESQILSKKPIADFFPQCTVLMADIAGFTSWSSEREPSQVFQLLQTVFFHFDKVW